MYCVFIQTPFRTAAISFIFNSKFYKKVVHYKEKLSKAKAMFLKETAWRDEKMKQQEKELRFLTLQLEKVKNQYVMS